MNVAPLETARLVLIPQTSARLRAQIDAMAPADRAQVSPEWLARLHSDTPDPWTLGFAITERAGGAAVGSCGFKAPPDAAGMVELAYGIDPTRQNRGYATEAAQALVGFALASRQVRVVRAHTMAEANASTRVLVKSGFTKLGEVIDPEDGLVWRWERSSEG
jgi:RimJ/RimL family protein N-acetyltransferase